MCAPHLQVLDHVIYVDRNRVSQAEVAQQLLTKGMKEVRLWVGHVVVDWTNKF